MQQAGSTGTPTTVTVPGRGTALGKYYCFLVKHRIISLPDSVLMSGCCVKKH